MKNFSITIILSVFLIPVTTLAQDSYPSFAKGIRAGWQNSGMYRSGTQNFDNLNSFYVGIFSESSVSENWSGGSGIEYFQTGFEDVTGNFKMHIISLPIYIKPRIGPVFGTAGLALNFKISDNREDFPGVISDPRFFDLPLTLGGGVQFGPVVVEAKYYWGLFNAANLDGLGHKNRYVQVGAAFMF